MADPRSKPGPRGSVGPGGRSRRWRGDDLQHLVDNSLGHMALATSALLGQEMSRAREIHHLQLIQQHVQYLALVTQAWTLVATTQEERPAMHFAQQDLGTMLARAVQPYDRERLGIQVLAHPALPPVWWDAQWWQFLLRAHFQVGVMQGQRCRLEARPGEDQDTVELRFRRHGTAEAELSPAATTLLKEACWYIIERHAGTLSVRVARSRDWQAKLEIPCRPPPLEP